MVNYYLNTKKLAKKILYAFILLLCFNNGFSQDIFKGNDLSRVNFDNISDAAILQYQDQIKTSGISELEAEQAALGKGLPPSELIKLHQRLASITIKKTSITNSNNGSDVTANEISTGGIINTKIFGSELFSTPSLSFQPDLKIATPVNYQLGPDDQLQITVHGLQEASFTVTVSPEGTIDIPNVGELKVSGYTVEEARERIRSRMSSIYTSLRSGTSQLSINLGKIRSIRVTILGSSKPGTYTVSSLTTVFNVLYLSGGPSANGSYREIELLRNNKTERKIDLYTFLLTGSEADNVRLQENDIIRIPVYKVRADIEGEVKRPGIFEMLPNETLNDLLRFAGGFSDTAYRASIKVIQLTDKEKKVKDISVAEFKQYQPSTGDYFEVSKILDRFQNRVSIEGAVFRPGFFELSNNLSLGQLIRKAEGLREDAYTKRGLLIRLQENLEPEIIPFDVNSVLNNSTDIQLKREDRIYISSIFELKDQYQLSIQGEVRKPGVYNYLENLSLKDLILQAGGFTGAAYPQRIEIARIIRRDTLTAQDVRLSEIIDVRDLTDLSLTTNNIKLLPGDIVTVRRLPGFLLLQSVTISGQVQYPGPYVLANRLEKVSDLLKRSGGFTPEAYPYGSYLKRLNENTVTKQVDTLKVEKIQRSLKDTTGAVTSSVVRPFDQIPLDLADILAHPGTEADLILKSGDELFIPRNDEQIKLSGEVLFPTQMPYKRGKDLKSYISDAGGFTDDARKKRLYVLYPNGKAVSTHHFLFFRNYPEIQPGAEIIVPKYIEKQKTRRSPTETIALTSALASLTYLVILIFKNL